MELRPTSELSDPTRQVLLYFPEKVTGAHHQTMHSSMWKVGCLYDFPNRRPSHYAELPVEPALETA